MKTLPHIFLTSLIFLSCSNSHESAEQLAEPAKDEKSENTKSNPPAGMVWIPGGTYIVGSVDENARNVEGPEFEATVDGFWMDETEVTNAEFRKFTEATGYLTVAERPVDWDQIKVQLPEGTPKPPDSVLQPGSLIFNPTEATNLYDISQWWSWQVGANWQHPHGPGSDIDGLDDYPVVHIAYEDAKAYADWAGKRLPTEVEWEIASRGGSHEPFAWGNELTPQGKYLANFYQGSFPDNNLASDGYVTTAPVKSYPPNEYGLYDMIGNVWEWTNDWYRPDTYVENRKQADIKGCINPSGPGTSYDPQEPLVPKRVTKGGSFLCSDEYCSNYRPSARMATAFDSGQEHLGFRCVRSTENKNTD